MKNVAKAVEISDAKIQYISLVDKAANLRQFLVVKQAGGNAAFSTLGKILKVDSSTHYITGIVYEPLVEDAHGNFMTEDEIKKAAYWYAENGDKVDIQHSFEAAGGLSVVENYVAPSDITIGDTLVAKGSWVITVKCTNDEIWSAVQNGELTGFSMGGIGKYSEEDTDLDTVAKNQGNAQAPASEQAESKSIIKKLGKLLGLDMVEKGEVMERYTSTTKSSAFWNAMWALEDVLYRYNWSSDRYEFAADEATIREALEEFSTIVTSILSAPPEAIIKSLALPVEKAGKKMSSANKKKLDDICQALSDFKSSFDEDDEDEEAGDGATVKKEENIDMDKKEITAIAEEAVTKALEAAGIIKKEATPEPAAAPVAAPAAPAVSTPAPAPEAAPAPAEAPTEDVVAKAVRKVLMEEGFIDPDPVDDSGEPATKGDVEAIVTKAVATAVAPLLKARGLPTNLNDTGAVEKSETHYLHGIL